MLSDFRYAVRSLLASRAFTVVALVILTLGIGASTAIFSVVDAVVLRSVPFDNGHRLMVVTSVYPKTTDTGTSQTPQDFLDWQRQQDVFASIMATSGANVSLQEDGNPEGLRAIRATASLFAVLRVAPSLGRAFTEANEADGAQRVAVLSDSFWRRRFGADPNVVGRSVTIDAARWEIIGVMPPAFAYPVSSTRPTDLYVPFVIPASQRQRANTKNSYLTVVGRLKDGVTEQQAAAQLGQITFRLAAEHPKWFGERSATVRSLHETMVGSVRQWMLLLLGAVGVVLLIACVNVANLMLARATTRTREIGVRAALGASRWRLARGLLAESLVLSAAGTAAGVIVALWGVGILRAALPDDLPRIATIGVDLRVLGVAAATAIATGLFFGLAPALQFSRPSLTSVMRDGGRGATAGRGRQALRSTLVVVEVALAVILLVGAGLFISSFSRVAGIDLGLETNRVFAVGVSPRINFADQAAMKVQRARITQEMPRLVDRIKVIPGVEAAALVGNGLPLTGDWTRTGVKVPGIDKKFEGDDSADYRQVTPDYHATIRQRLVRGRYLSESDVAGAPMVVVLNEEAARRYLPGREPLGANLTMADADLTVVGVVGNVRLEGPEQPARPEAYVPVAQDSILGADVVVRAAGRPESVLPAVTVAIREMFPDLVIPRAVTLDELYSGLIAQRRFNMLLVGVFGVLALVIAAVGIYGVMAYIVQQRTQEIGVRLALGAQPTGVLLMVLRRATAFLVAGLVLGGVIAYVLAAKVATFLFQVQPTDPIVFGVAAGVLLLAGLAAAFVPARRASQVDPLVAIRE